MKMIGCLFTFLLLGAPFLQASENEVLPDTRTRVVVRDHPKTGEPYVSIVSVDEPARTDLLSTDDIAFDRPDYRMLDHKQDRSQISYTGPYSSRKKIYIFAASVATLGAVGSVAAGAAFPAAAGAAASGTGTGVGIASVAVGAGTAAAAIKLQETDLPDDYQRISESQLLETETDFYRIHIKKNE